MADKQPDVYREDGRWVFRASSFGACDRALVMTMAGLKPDGKPDWLQAAMNTSAAHEAPILSALSSGYGWKLLDGLVLEQYGTVGSDGQVEAELDVRGATGGIIRCHPDGIAQCYKARLSDSYGIKDRVVVEAKAMKLPARDVLKSSEWYRWQTSIEMAVTGLPLLWVVGWKDDNGELITINGKPDITVLYIPEPFYTPAQINARVRRLTTLHAKYESGGGFPGCTWKMYPCGYWPLHDRETGVWMEQKTELTGATAAKVRRYAKLWADAKGREVEAAEARKELGRKIEELVGEDVSGKIDAGNGVEFVRVVKKGSKKFNRKRAEDAGIDLEPYYDEGAPTSYIDKVTVA